MRKEVALAIASGLVLGLIIAFGVWRLNSALYRGRKTTTVEASPTPRPEFAITLAKPANGSVITESQTVISGITKPMSFVAISSEEDDYVTQADAKGSFEEEISLIGGVNQILIYAFDEKGNEVRQELLLVYSSEFERYLSKKVEESREATPSVREKVLEKLNQALNSPTSLLGTVTDIAEKTIQIKTTSGEIEQLSLSEETSVVNIVNAPKEVKLKDIAIGDFIVSLGFKNGNGVLDTKRILVTSPLPQPERKAVFVKVSKVGTKDILAQSVKTEEDQKILPSKGASIFLIDEGKFTRIKMTDLKPDYQLIAFGTLSPQNFSARSIFVVRRP